MCLPSMWDVSILSLVTMFSSDQGSSYIFKDKMDNSWSSKIYLLIISSKIMSPLKWITLTFSLYLFVIAARLLDWHLSMSPWPCCEWQLTSMDQRWRLTPGCAVARSSGSSGRWCWTGKITTGSFQLSASQHINWSQLTTLHFIFLNFYRQRKQEKMHFPSKI